jgi:hypothetical protein
MDGTSLTQRIILTLIKIPIESQVHDATWWCWVQVMDLWSITLVDE